MVYINLIQKGDREGAIFVSFNNVEKKRRNYTSITHREYRKKESERERENKRKKMLVSNSAW